MKKFTFGLICLILSFGVFATERIKEVGRIEFNKKSNSFIFYFIKNNKISSVIIHPVDKKQSDELLNLQDKAIILDGEIKAYVKNNDSFNFQEEVNNSKVSELNKELLKIDTKKILTQYNLVSHEKNIQKYRTKEATIQITDKSANTVIGIAGAVIGIAAGPIALIPAAAYIIEELKN